MRETCPSRPSLSELTSTFLRIVLDKDKDDQPAYIVFPPGAFHDSAPSASFVPLVLYAFLCRGASYFCRRPIVPLAGDDSANTGAFYWAQVLARQRFGRFWCSRGSMGSGSTSCSGLGSKLVVLLCTIAAVRAFSGGLDRAPSF